MPNRYARVLFTYVCRPFSSFTAGMLVVLGLIMTAVSLAMPKAIAFGGFPVFMFGLAMIVVPLWLHFRDQIVHPARHLLPNFLLPHLVPFIAIALLLSAAIPEIIALRAGVNSVGLLVLSMAMFALWGWWALTLSPWLMVLAILAIDSLAFSSSLREIITPFITGQHEMLAFCLLALSIIAAIVPVVLICRLAEDNAPYRKRAYYDTWSVRERMTGEANHAWQIQQFQRFTWLRFRTHLILPTGTSLWSGSRRWSNINSGAGYTRILLLMGVVLLAICALQFRNQPHDSTDAIWPIMIFLCVIPPLMIPQAWLRLWRFLEADSLRPLERDRFLKEMALAMASHFATALLITSTFAIAATFLFKLIPLDPPRLLQLLAQIIFIQIFAYGLSVWQMRYRSPGRLMISMIPVCAATGFLLDPLIETGRQWQLQALLGGAGLATLGILIAFDAYQRWLTTELG